MMTFGQRSPHAKLHRADWGIAGHGTAARNALRLALAAEVTGVVGQPDDDRGRVRGEPGRQRQRDADAARSSTLTSLSNARFAGTYWMG